MLIGLKEEWNKKPMKKGFGIFLKYIKLCIESYIIDNEEFMLLLRKDK